MKRELCALDYLKHLKEFSVEPGGELRIKDPATGSKQNPVKTEWDF